jgi:predicted metal-dependent hydrolase
LPDVQTTPELVALDVTVRRHPRARRYVLRVASDGGLRLTVPTRASVKGGLAFVERQREWIGRERARIAAREAERAGQVEDMERLRLLAETQLADRCRELADKHAVPISGVQIRDQRSRWGSCSPKGSISLNWRLIRMPGYVSDYVILHELMHRRQPNHSAKFWNEVGHVCPEWRDAERWLRKNGRDYL